MAEKLKELEKQIVEKNLVLDSLNRSKKENKEKICRVKKELDKLLFAYYKSLSCRYGNVFIY